MTKAEFAALTATLDKLKSLHPVKIDLSLDRIEVLLDKLDRPQDRLPPVIHVAGTNGKGSTVAFLRAIHEAAGYRVHTFTSPHLVNFTERIMLGGIGSGGRAGPIPVEDLIAVLEAVLTVNGDAPITFFEIVTAAAFQAFATVPADLLILEVGLGGRLDATNVVDRPAASVITPISRDHIEMLGDTLPMIAREKAGILKPAAPGVIGWQELEVSAVIEECARDVGAPLTIAGRDFDAFEQNGRLVFQREDRLLDLPLPGLVGRHQIANAGLAVATTLAVGLFDVSEEAIGRGLLDVTWPARFMRLDKGALISSAGEHTEVWLDGGHNPSAGAALAQALAELDERAPKPVFLIVGMMARKDARNFLAPFQGLVRGLIAVPLAGHEEDAHDPVDLCDIAESLEIDAADEDDVRAAISTIEAWELGPKRILICGSIYLAGAVLVENDDQDFAA